MNRQGFTLVEVLTAIAVFSIVVTIAAGAFVSAMKAQGELAGIIAMQSNASTALEQMTREIRTGSQFSGSGGSLSFTNAKGQGVTYGLQGGALARNSSPLTGANMTVTSLSFIVFGNTSGDHWNPLITILMNAAPNSSGASGGINLETSVSARAIDCDAAGKC